MGEAAASPDQWRRVKPQTPGVAYGGAVFAMHAGDIEEASRSAEVIVPLIVDLLNPRSVIDVGCGTGRWLRAFVECGVPEVRGLDLGPPEELAIDPALYTQVDMLNEAIPTEERYDLAICLEVAEHLPVAATDGLIDSLSRLSDLVLFSAAIPGQGGPGHVTERWQGSWAMKFAQRGLQAFDVVRPKVWGNPEVAWWYQQNVLLYAQPGAAPAPPATMLDLVHPAAYERVIRRAAMPPSLRDIPRVVARSTAASMRRGRLGRLRRGGQPGHE